MTTENQTETQNPTEVQNHETTTPFPRVGKIARLPKAIREELNARLDAGEGGEPLLDWLNQLPDTRKVLALEFAAKPISKQNLSDWRRGGFAEWQLRRSLLETAADTATQAKALNGIGSRFFVDDLVVAFSAHLSRLLMRWDGEISEDFQAKLRVYTRVRRDLSKLQRDVHWAFRDSDECAQLEAGAEQRRITKLKEQALAPAHSFERRHELVNRHGVYRGEKMAEALDLIDYGVACPKWQPDPEDEDEPAETPVRKPRTARPKKTAPAAPVKASSTMEKAPSSQGSAEPAQAVAVAPASVENAPIKSSPVKPLSETLESRQDEAAPMDELTLSKNAKRQPIHPV